MVKIKGLLYFPLWVVIILTLFGLSLIEYFWLAVKKRKFTQKIIYSDLVQTLKEKLTDHPMIIK